VLDGVKAYMFGEESKIQIEIEIQGITIYCKGNIALATEVKIDAKIKQKNLTVQK